MVINQDEPQETIQFYDNPPGYLICNQCEGYYELKNYETPDDFETCSCGSSLEYVTSLTELNNPDLESSENISHKVALMNQLTSQTSFTEEILTNRRQDSGNLWDNLEHFNPNEIHNNQSFSNDVIEMNRMMMMVDQKRALEESNPSRYESVLQKVGLIGLLGGVIVLLILILTLTILGGMN